MKDRYWIAFIIGLILTPFAHKAATAQRGYFAVGGEILIIPLLMILVLAADQVKEIINEINEVFREREEREWKQKERASSTGRC